MKNLLSILSVLLVVMGVNAQFSTLDLAVFNQMPVRIKLDGQMVANNVQQVQLNQLPAGNHFIEVVAMGNPYSYGYKPMNILYSGSIMINPNTYIQAMIYPNQLQIVQQYALAPTPPPYQQGNYGQNGNHPNQGGNSCGNNGNYNGNNQGQNNGGYPYGNQGNYGGNGQSYNGNNNNYNYPPMPQEMEAVAFQSLKQTIDNQWFSSGKQDVFKQALAGNYFTSQQVSELVNLYSFDSDKLVVAKMAYTKTIDPQNYFMVSNQLGFSSSVNDLTAYMASL